MRYSLVIAATLMTTSAQAQPWRYAQPRHFAPFAYPAPRGPGGFAPPPFFRPAPSLPYYPPPQAPAYAPVYRPPAYARVPRPSPPVIVPVAPRVPIVPVPVAPVMPVQPAPFVAAPVAPLTAVPPIAPVARAMPDLPVTPAASVAPGMTESATRGSPESASPAGLLSGLPLKLLVPVAGIGALAWYGRRRIKGAGAPKDGHDFAELPY